ncbi:DUF3891 family protein [Mucilaginibacter ginsenosidivorax]|uniref:DUF3891 family protein n=1 Tax=Mucilaginibacter ginsenosidivorax TaxID=862126 RepID=A0A5B8VVV6_9SPHI|nr:DUF3891 family protein [Mucilaginibacter ginsenosidivorax]QEC74745.1 DUF3891 family protein [Mucilaginibacter ginsenosidivorax]
MIVNYTESGWEVITQRAHGLLAAQIAQQWKHYIRSNRWTELLLAIAEHDDAQVELERDNLLTPQGGPIDFKMKVFEQRHCTQTIDFALSKSRYIALLCSMHLDFVYGTECIHNVPARKFMQEQKNLQKRWRKELGLTQAEAERDYRLLEWCDALSLLLCQQENQPEARAVEISKGPDNKEHRLIQSADHTLTVEPWPFESSGFEVCFETRLIPQLRFKNAAAFRSAFLEAAVTEKRWTFKRG